MDQETRGYLAPERILRFGRRLFGTLKQIHYIVESGDCWKAIFTKVDSTAKYFKWFYQLDACITFESAAATKSGNFPAYTRFFL